MASRDKRGDPARPVGLLALLFIFALAPAPAISSGSTRIDQDAAIVARIDPSMLASLLARARQKVPRVQALTATAGAFSKSHFGADVTQLSGLSAVGINVKKPIWLQLAAIDANQANTVYRRLIAAKDWTPSFLRATRKVFWRTRAVIPVTSRKRALRVARSLLQLTGDVLRVRNQSAAQLALLFGERRQYEPLVVKALARLGISDVAYSRVLSAYLFLRPGRKQLVIDILTPFAGAPLLWRRDKKAIVRALGHSSRSWRGPGSGVQLLKTRVALGVWLSASRLLATFETLLQTRELHKIAVQLPQPPPAPITPPPSSRCATLNNLVKNNDLQDLSILVRNPKQATTIELIWHTAPGSTIFTKDLATHHRLATREGAVLEAFMPANHLASALRTAQPAASLGSIADTRHALRNCSAGASTILLLFGWPQIASQLLKDATAAHLTTTFPGHAATQIVLSIRKLGIDLATTTGIIEGLFAKSTAAEGTKSLRAAFGPPHQKDSLTTWGRGPIIPYQRAAGDEIVLGISFGAHSLAYQSATQPASIGRSVAKNTIVSLRANPQHLLQDQRGSWQLLHHFMSQQYRSLTASLLRKKRSVALHIHLAGQ